MPEMTVREFADELIDGLEDRLEGHFTPAERARICGEFERAIRRLDGEKLDA